MSDLNPVLTKYADKLLIPEGEAEDCSATRVFVPLCGKTLDMVYLANRAGDLYGVEGIQTALEEFVEEHPELQIQKKGVSNADGIFERYEGQKIIPQIMSNHSCTIHTHFGLPFLLLSLSEREAFS